MESWCEDFLPNLWFMTGPLLEIWKECCFTLNWFCPSQPTETDLTFCKEGKNTQTGSWTMPLCTMVYLLMSAATTSGLPEITGGRGWVSVHIDKYAASKDRTQSMSVDYHNCEDHSSFDLNLLLTHSYLDLLMNNHEILMRKQVYTFCTFSLILSSASGYSVMSALYKLYNNNYYYYCNKCYDY